ncbi:alpha/beta fold hydrolase [Heyndrickxia acidicola]|uniref:Alpha/beta hydrolase n=1 Tax=Heyndrickxia acidicola TaxID=209389 RepID=A0ABU6MR40_9BACI|nr:alpha/beta hydrolase [Heyndrickxia acidicola]MED1205515.1 alpha/beta hydrolase [Heyndrickxia acidicola]
MKRKNLTILSAQVPPFLYWQLTDLSIFAFLIEDLVKIVSPILFLTGEDDRVNSSQYLALNTLYFPNCRYYSILNAKSFFIVELPSAVSKIIVDFLETKETNNIGNHDPFLNSIEEEIKLYIQQIQQKG